MGGGSGSFVVGGGVVGDGGDDGVALGVVGGDGVWLVVVFWVVVVVLWVMVELSVRCNE